MDPTTQKAIGIKVRRHSFFNNSPSFNTCILSCLASNITAIRCVLINNAPKNNETPSDNSQIRAWQIVRSSADLGTVDKKIGEIVNTNKDTTMITLNRNEEPLIIRVDRYFNMNSSRS